MTLADDQRMIRAAIVAARSASDADVPVGAVVFDADGVEVARASNAREAAVLLADGVPRRSPCAPHQPIDDLPHLADQEYTMVSTTAGNLVATTVTELESRFPAMRDYSDQQRQHTIEDIAHIVDFLAVALYTDDDALFTEPRAVSDAPFALDIGAILLTGLGVGVLGNVMSG